MIESVYPLSPAQEGMLFHGLYAPGTEEYLLQLRCGLRGPLDVARFRAAWAGVLARHGALRSSVVWDGVPRPVQVVQREVALPWQDEDWRGQPAAAQAARVAEYVRWDRATGFTVTQAPLWRLWLQQQGAEAYEFVWSAHHLVVDGWSSAQVLAEVLAQYAGTPLPAAGRYRDYIAWLQQQDGAAAEQYWRRALRGVRTPTTWGPRGAVQRRYAEVTYRVPGGRRPQLTAAARAWDVTLSTVVLGAWGLVLSRYSGDREVVFGATLTDRPAAVPGVETMVGVFINTLPVRVPVPRATAIGPWLQAIQREQVEARQYGYSPLVAVQGWSEVPRGTALFDSVVVMANYPVAPAVRRGAVGGVQVATVTSYERTSYPVTVMVRGGEELTLTLIYDEGRYGAAWAEAAVTQLGQVVEGLAERPTAAVGTVAVVRGRARRALVSTWNRTAQRVRAGTVPAWIWATAERQPGAPAVVGAGETWSYAQLVARAEAVAAALQAQGVGPETVVAVSGPRTPALVAGLLGVLRAGAAYLPVDPQTPASRVAHMLDEAQVRVVVTAGGGPPWPGARPTIVVDEVPARPAPPWPALQPDHLAYIIYTSGSTGQPKGVMNTHRGLANRLDWMQRTYGLTRDDCVLHKTHVGFDVSIWELLWPLMTGAVLALAPPGAERDMTTLAECIVEHEVTTLHMVPSVLQFLVEHPRFGDCRSLHRVISSGEALPSELVQRFFARSRAGLHNLYGPTEASIDVSFWECEREHRDATVPIGRPIANTRLHVLDRDGDLAPVGAVGHLFIGGEGLARGYVGRPDLTAARFVPDPVGTEPGSRLYDTGDRALYERCDGVLTYVGRRDFQMKIHGVRIEPGEVEVHLAAHPDVRYAAVIGVAYEQVAAQRLVAYVVPRAGCRPTPEVLRRHLAERVIEPMIPGAFVFLDALPLTASGKLDRGALPTATPADSHRTTAETLSAASTL